MTIPQQKISLKIYPSKPQTSKDTLLMMLNYQK